jgi:hypothetical protein
VRLSGRDTSDQPETWRIRLEYRVPDDPEPVTVEVPQVRIDRGSLSALVAALKPWLAQPLGALANDPLAYAIDLAADPASRLLLELGEREDVITVVGGVGCRIELVYNGMTTSVAFATDPTCLEALAKDFDGVLGQSR